MVVVVKTKEDIKKAKKVIEERRPEKIFNARKFCGVLKVDEDPRVIQQRLRDEWE
jgi:hypothetical protein